jgi:REP element-mobilizing transposase RayT
MPRSPRIHYPGAIYHAMSRGVDGREIFLDDSDRTTFCRMLAETKKSHGLRVFAYCLMGNHFHLLIQIGDSPLYSGMHQFLTRYSLYFNQRHDRVGYLFQSRYTAALCRQDSYLRILLRYIHLNPVRANLVNDPGEWIWSGHRGLIGRVCDELLDSSTLAELRGETLSQLRAAYLDSLQEGDPYLEYKAGPSGVGRDIPSIDLLAGKVAREFGLSPVELCGGKRGKRMTQAKLEFIEKAHGNGHLLRDIAATLNCTPAAITLLRRRKKLILCLAPLLTRTDESGAINKSSSRT